MAMITSTPMESRASTTARSSRRSGASPSGVSPTRLTRLQEKEDLRHLNDRLANYIERVRQLENDKSSMQLLLEEKEESSVREVGNVRRLYETELADARKSLDATANERARLQIELTQLKEDHRKLTSRNNKKECELNTAVGHWRNLEAALNSKEADYANLLAANRRLENDLSDLKTQVANLETALQNVKTQLNSEMLRRVDAENQIQTLQEQLDFQKHLSEQEVREMRSRHESRLMELDSGRQKEFEGKLAEAMKQLREEHEAQIQQYKDELEKTFAAKIEVVCRRSVVQGFERQEEAVTWTRRKRLVSPHLSFMLENAKQTAVKNSDFASSTREELAGTKLRLESQSLQINNLHKQNAALEARVQELEQMLDRERQLNQHRLSQKEQEMADMRQQMQEQLEEYQNLLDVKLMLDMEINAYRKMLEGEEKRLNLSPSPIQQSTVSRTHTQPGRKSWGKKRKHEGTSSGLSPSYKLSQHSSSRGNVSIDEIDLQGRYIKLKNNSDKDQALGGWVLRKSEAGAPDIIFQIPSPCVLNAGQMLTIWAAGAGLEQMPSQGDLVLRTHETWGPFGEVRVSLLNPQNEETAEYCLVCVQGKGDEDPEYDESIMTRDIHLRRQCGCETWSKIILIKPTKDHSFHRRESDRRGAGSMFKGWSSWLGGELENEEKTDKQETTEEKNINTETEESQQILQQAKGLSGFILNFASTATKKISESVAETAQTIKKTVEESNIDGIIDKTILGDFQKEQEKFVQEKNAKKTDAAVPPWVGYNEEETIQQQILALSADKRNFLRDPPAGVQFHFDFEQMYPVALVMLQEDELLNRMRFDLVPKQVKEDVFWRNYFYRVSLIKQSAQLTALAAQQQAAEKREEEKNAAAPLNETLSETIRPKTPPVAISAKPKTNEEEEDISTSPGVSEFVSDAFDACDINQEDLRKEMEQLVLDKKDEETADWEKELQQELQEYEVVIDLENRDDNWDREIEEMLQDDS
ncbi:Lamin-L(III) [Anabarilius grahami]|uniref:Synapse-associated protein 1 n=1 Tax=Anabarilius grahami TaxID=495550 RepID=A0A3N0Y0V2_ANAGA|nr:Lamin-L(III) [Anabarilius grahami]